MLSVAVFTFVLGLSKPAQLALPSPSEGQNTLSQEEVKQGFKLVFDGKSLDGFKGWKHPETPKRWHLMDGLLTVGGEGTGGDIRLADVYKDFELRLEWKIQKGGNSGVIYRCTEDHDAPWQTGPEYQLLDDANAGDGKRPITSAASVYGLYAPSSRVVKPAMEWNESKIVVKGSHVEHWLNGVLVTTADIGSDGWNDLVKKSKFAAMPDFGKRTEGFIALQDHGNDVWFKCIRVRRL